MKHHKRHLEGEKTEQTQQGPAPLSQASQDKAAEAPHGPEDLKPQLQDLQKERDDLFARLQRLSADYSNYQKRVPKQINDSVVYEKEKLIRTLLPVLDNFELTIQKAGAAENAEMVLAGIRIVWEQMLGILKSHGVEPVKATDEKFDPTRHEALMQRCDPEKEDNLILEECQRGYVLAGKLLRPSKVIVNRAPTLKPAQDSEGDQTEKAHQEEETPDVE